MNSPQAMHAAFETKYGQKWILWGNEDLKEAFESGWLAGRAEMVAALGAQESVVTVEDAGGQCHFPRLQWVSANASLETPIGTKLYAAPVPPSVKEGWRPIETAPKGVLVVVSWIDAEDGEARHNFDYLEDGVWWNYFSEHEHYMIAGVTRGRSEDAPYTHWTPLPNHWGPLPAAPSPQEEK